MNGRLASLCVLCAFLLSGCGNVPGLGPDHSIVAKPVAARLAEDSRNAVFSLEARYGDDSTTLVLDLREVSSAAPADLWRGLFQSAEALHDEGLTFDHVILERSGSPVFLMSGEDFGTLGAEFGGGQNPVYLLRTLPEKLDRPDGQAAFATWEGGLIGVATKQMKDVNTAAKEWAKQP
jgi:predicted small secreted protein